MKRSKISCSDRLSVYGTNGEEFYPGSADSAGHPDANRWFLQSGLRCYLDTAGDELMMYLGDVRHPTELDQAFAVYQHHRPDTDLIDGFITTTRHCLEDDCGWRLLESTKTTEVKSLYHLLAETTATSARVQVANYTDYGAELVQDVLQSDRTEPLHVLAGDYRVAAQVISAYADVSGVRVHIYNQRSVDIPAEVDLAVSVEVGPYDLEIPDETAASLDELAQRRSRAQARKRMEKTVKRIEAHASADDSVRVVKDAVEEGLEENYGSYEILTAQERERLETDLEDARERMDRQSEEISSLRQELDVKNDRISRLESDAAISSYIDKATQTLRNPSNFLFDSTGNSSLRSQQTTRSDDAYMRTERRESTGRFSDNLPSRLRWGRVALILALILAGILIGILGIPGIFEGVGIPAFDLPLTISH